MHSSRPRIAPTSLWLSLALILVFPTMSVPPAQGVEFLVDSPIDEIDVNPGDGFCVATSGGCTLRAAVIEANALAGADTIRLPAMTPGPSLTLVGAGEDASLTGDLDILDDLTITGDGMAVSGAEASGLSDRALHVHPGVMLDLSGVSFFWADAGAGQNGGGIRNEGTASIVETSFQFSRAHNGAGVMNVGDMTLVRSVVGYNTASDAGGGIRNDGTLTIEQSTVANNEVTAGPGGGIENHGILIVRNSTISQNRATSLAAALYNGFEASATVNNGTIFANAVLPDEAGSSGTGGIFNEASGSVRLSNSIVAFNTFGPTYAEADCMGLIISAGYNLFRSLADCTVTGDLTGNLIGVDPLLPALPTVDPAQTWGYPPLEGSPAIDAGNPATVGSSETACEIIDQRGYARPIGFVCDLGAYESEFGVVGTPSWTPTEVETLPPSPTPGTPTSSATATFTATATDTPSPTSTYTSTATATSTYTSTATATSTHTSTATATSTYTSTARATSTRTFTPVVTPSFTPTGTVLTPTPTRTPSATHTRTGTANLTGTYTPTSSPSAMGSATATPLSSPTPTPTATSTLTPTPTVTQTPSVTPMPAPQPLFADGFETGNLSAWSSSQTDQGDLNVTAAAAIGGSYGLRAALDDNRSIYVVDDTPSAETAYRARFYFDPNGISMASGNAHIVFLARDVAGVVAFRIELRSFQGDYQVRAVAPVDFAPAMGTAWIPITDTIHQFEVAWWSASGQFTDDGGLLLWIDDSGEPLAGFIGGLDNDTRRVDSVRLGAVSGIDAGTRGTYFFDAFASTEGFPIGPDPSILLPSPTPPPDLIFADGFETGDLSAWSEVRSDGDLSVRTSAALEGAYGMKVLVDDTSPLYVTDWNPFGEEQYRSRFAFDPNSLTMLDGRSHFIFQAIQGSAKVVARVEFRFKSGAYQLRAAAWDESGSWRNTSWWNIDDAPHVVELLWKAPAGFPADGVMSLWLDGVEVERQEAVYSVGLQIDFVRLGAVAGLDNGTHGSMYFDAFESRRETYIGPPSGP